jgi:hypothetical protein
MLVVACKDNSGVAHRVSTGHAAVTEAAPEPPGGPPSCADVGAQLAQQVGADKDIEAKVAGGTVAVRSNTMPLALSSADRGEVIQRAEAARERP